MLNLCMDKKLKIMKKILSVAAPSGAGKSTIVKILQKNFSNLLFSVSATTREPRGTEVNGREYFFISVDEFKKMIADGELVEWQEVYLGKFYGTPKSEMNRIVNEGNIMLLDIDVYGALDVKNKFGDDVLTVFIKPPAPELSILEDRIRRRGFDTEDQIKTRLGKAEEELSQAKYFDYILINDELGKAETEIVSYLARSIE